MENIKSQFVTYEIAKKLKELGFNEPCLSTYTYDGFKYDTLTCISENQSTIKERLNSNSSNFTYSAPLWQQVTEWLRKKHGVFITASYNVKMERYKVDVFDTIKKVYLFTIDGRNKRPEYGWETPQEAYSEAINYILDKLIKQ